MYSKKAENLLKMSLNKFSPDEGPLTIQRIKSLNLAPAILKYIFNSYESFDDRTVISKDDLKNLIKRAITFNVNYLLNPVPTLKKNLFHENTEINSVDIKKFTGFLYYFSYFSKAIEKYLLTSNQIVEKDHFENYMFRVDRALQKNHLEFYICDGLESLENFLNTSLPGINTLHHETLNVFFQKRDLYPVYHKIREYDRSDDISIIFLRNYVQKAISENEVVVETPQEVAPVDSSRFKKTFEMPESQANEYIESKINEYANQFPAGNFEQSSELRVKSTKVEFEEIKDAVKPEVPGLTVNLPDNTNRVGFNNEPKENSTPPLSTSQKNRRGVLTKLLSEDETLSLIMNLFDGDHSDFSYIVERIESSNNIDDALDILDPVFRRNKISQMTDKDAKMLVEKIQDLFLRY